MIFATNGLVMINSTFEIFIMDKCNASEKEDFRANPFI